MNVRKLSLTSLLLMMVCSFGWAQGEGEVPSESTTPTFVKVTSVTQLVPGNKFLFVVAIPEDAGITDANGFAISKIKNGKRLGAKVNIEPSPVDGGMEIITTEIDVDNKAYALTLGGDTEDGFTFFDNVNGGYIKAPDGQGNQFGELEHDEDLDDGGKWLISYNETKNCFEIRNKKDTGKWIICRHPGNNGMPAFVASKDGYPEAYLFVQYSKLETITLARSNGGDDLNYYATGYFAKDMKLDDNVSAYNVKPVPSTTETQTLTLEEIVPAGEILGAETPAILMVVNENADAAPYVDYPIYTYATADRTQETNLQGTLETINAPENSFKLRKQEVEDEETGESVLTVAFFKAEGTSILANKAYYVIGEEADPVDPTGEVKVLTFSFGGSSTGIQKVNTNELSESAIYNMAGQQVNKNYRGIVLQNGKKYLRK